MNDKISDEKAYPKFSVLMSIYRKENPSYLKTALDSVINQSLPPDEIVMVKDGALTKELDETLESYSQKYPQLFHFVPLEKNVGLGAALAEGVKNCSNELVARMDTDDISVHDRFETQIAEFMKDETLDICGGQISEFEDSPENIVARRTVPLSNDEIKKYQRRRDGFNHVSVMFRRQTVLDSGNYQSALLMEDTLLWANMFMHGAKGMNIDKDLVLVRIGNDMYERRGGFEYFRKYKKGRKMVRDTGFIGAFDYYYTLLVQLCVALVPTKLRGFIFKKLLHKGS